MPHTLVHTQAGPWWRDPGVATAAGWLIAITLFNAFQTDPVALVVGTGIAAPFIAATMAERWHRVLYVGVATIVVVTVTLQMKYIPYDTASKLRVASILVATAVAAWAAARRLSQQRRMVDVAAVAEAVQLAVLRLDAPDAYPATVRLRYRAADVEALIGGDALEAVQTPWGVRILVADARGKGLGALRTSTSALGAFREWAPLTPDLGDLLARMNESLERELAPEDFVTALVAQLDGLELTFVSAGHPMPLLVRANETRELDLGVRTAPLAMPVPRRIPVIGKTDLMAGDVVLMVTDGLLEARNPNGTYFPFDLESAEAMSTPDLDDGIDRLLAAASRHAGSRGLTDDVAVAALRIDDGRIKRDVPVSPRADERLARPQPT